MLGLNPGLSHCSLDNPDLLTTRLHFILINLFCTGIYKPRLRCYDLHNLGMKFERCLDAEVVTFEILSDDYSKVITNHGAQMPQMFERCLDAQMVTLEILSDDYSKVIT
jgi:hypothetical protein